MRAPRTDFAHPSLVDLRTGQWAEGALHGFQMAIENIQLEVYSPH